VFDGASLTIPEGFAILQATGRSPEDAARWARVSVTRDAATPATLLVNAATQSAMTDGTTVREDGRLCATTAPGAELPPGTVLRVSGELSEIQWVKLLDWIVKNQSDPSNPVRVMIHPNDVHVGLMSLGVKTVSGIFQPEPTPNVLDRIGLMDGVSLISTPSPELASAQWRASIPPEQPTLVVDISATQEPETLTPMMRVTSIAQRRFEIPEFNALTLALWNGTPILIRGATASRPAFQQLETLFLPKPYLIVNGRPEYFERARVVVIELPKDAATLRLGPVPHYEFPVGPDDIWTHVAARVGILPTEDLTKARALWALAQQQASVSLMDRSGLPRFELLTRFLTAGMAAGAPPQWGHAFRRVLLPLFKHLSELHEYLKCVVTDPGRDERIPTINRSRGRDLLDRALEGKPVSIWEWARCIHGLPLMESGYTVENGLEFPTKLAEQVRGAILVKVPQNEAERAVIRDLFSKDPVDMNWGTKSVAESFRPGASGLERLERQSARIVDDLRAPARAGQSPVKFLFLKGDPASGKSYLASYIQEFLIGSQVFGPVTMAPD
jgi:hypothetical protein